MTGMISDTDLARITLSLEGLDLLRDLLAGRGDDIDLDLLATILSECPPEKCLLVLACAANVLCEQDAIDAALKVSLKLLSGNVIDDYAPLYLARLKSSIDKHYEAQMIYMEEDLEGFAELFALAADLSPTESLPYQVCGILADQAAAQAEVLALSDPDIDYADMIDSGETEPPSLIIFSDNVVPFPGLFRKH